MSMDDLAGREPVRVFEDEATGDRFLIYGTADGPRVELRFDGEALWMTQAQMADLFGRDVSVISRHIAAVLSDGELDETTSLQKMQTNGLGRPGVLYSLDMVISVGYRVSSAQATLFRRWATAVLVRFATRGFVIDAARLKGGGEQDRVAELRDIIRDIRASEANVYAEIRRICSLCQDYDPKSDAWREFFRQTQAKLCYAVTNMTPAQVIIGRADSDQESMGLQTWAGEQPPKGGRDGRQELSAPARDQGVEPADRHPFVDLRRPVGNRQADHHGAGFSPARQTTARSGTHTAHTWWRGPQGSRRPGSQTSI